MNNIELRKLLGELQFRHKKVLDMDIEQLRLVVAWMGSQHQDWFDEKFGIQYDVRFMKKRLGRLWLLVEMFYAIRNIGMKRTNEQKVNS